MWKWLWRWLERIFAPTIEQTTPIETLMDYDRARFIERMQGIQDRMVDDRLEHEEEMQRVAAISPSIEPQDPSVLDTPEMRLISAKMRVHALQEKLTGDLPTTEQSSPEANERRRKVIARVRDRLDQTRSTDDHESDTTD